MGNMGAPQRVLSRDERADLLEDCLNAWLRYGAKIESRTTYSAVVVTGSEPNHVVHVILTVFTCGLWLPVWLIAAGSQSLHRHAIHVDEYGTVTKTP